MRVTGLLNDKFGTFQVSFANTELEINEKNHL